MEISDSIKDEINLERVKIFEETSELFRVHYAGKTYEIQKNTKTEFSLNHDAPPGMALEQRLEQRLVPETGIFQDDDVPIEYKEVMMFHEIREMECEKAEFDDAHERAMNDEILYVMKFFDEEKREKYLDFARGYRVAKADKTVEIPAIDMRELYGIWCQSIFDGTGWKAAYQIAEDLLGKRAVGPEEVDDLITFASYSPPENYWADAYMNVLLSAVINAVDESHGTISVPVPIYMIPSVAVRAGDKKVLKRRRERVKDLFQMLKRKKVEIIYDGRRKPICF